MWSRGLRSPGGAAGVPEPESESGMRGTADRCPAPISRQGGLILSTASCSPLTLGGLADAHAHQGGQPGLPCPLGQMPLSPRTTSTGTARLTLSRYLGTRGAVTLTHDI